jgi:hypothetical protein
MSRSPQRRYGRTGRREPLYTVEVWQPAGAGTMAKPHWRLLSTFRDRAAAEALLATLEGVKARIEVAQ